MDFVEGDQSKEEIMLMSKISCKCEIKYLFILCVITLIWSFVGCLSI